MKKAKQPRSIKIFGSGDIQIKPIGYKDSKSLPYLSVTSSNGLHCGYIEDRDVKRLLSWCQDCVKKRRSK